MPAALAPELLTMLCLAAAPAATNGPGSPIWQAYDRAQRFGSADLGRLVRNARIEAHWNDDGDGFWYRRDEADGHRFVRVDATTGTKAPAFDHDALAAALSRAAGQAFEAGRLPFRRCEIGTDGAVRFSVGSQAWEFRPATGECARLEPPPAAPPAEGPGVFDQARDEPRRRQGLSPDGRWQVVAREHNLFLVAEDGVETALTTDGSETGTYALRGWAPDSSAAIAVRTTPGDRLAMYTVESSPENALRPVLHTNQYDLPGDRVDTHDLYLVRVDDRSCRKLETETIDWWGPPELTWLPDGHTACYIQTHRGCQRRRLIAIDTGTGASTTVIDERSDTFLPPDKGWHQFLAGGSQIVWMSERSGWCHLYRFAVPSGELLNAVTTGEWVVRGVEEVDEAAGTIRFTGSGREPGDPYLLHQYRVGLDGTGFLALTAGDGQHALRFSPDKRFYLDEYSRVDLPPVTELRRTADGSLVCEVERADIAALLATGWKLPEPFSAKGRDGATDIWGVIYRPSTLDETAEYPVIENIYAGPQGSFTPKAFGVAGELQATAELGFVVVMIDGMGTSNRSKAFHDVAWHNLGDSGFADRILWMQAAAARYPYLDLSRVGIWGHSAGGYNAAHALIAHPEFYKVAVAQAGNHDHRTDKVWWNELWMGYPVGPHYAEQSNIVHAADLQGHLLLIHGELDENVNPSASTLQFANALIAADKDFDLLILPGNGHGFRGTYATRRRWNHFVRWLQGIEPPADYHLESAPGGECTITIRNATAQTIGIWWIPGDGGARKYHDLAPGAEIQQHTFYGHDWEARAGDRAIAWFAASPGDLDWRIGAP